MKTVLVTGGNGFIGNYCLKPLVDKGYKVHAFSRELDGPSFDGITWHRVDLLKNSFDGLVHDISPTHLLHLAWCTKHGEFWSSPLNAMWFETSHKLLNAFYKYGGQRFVSVGSCSEYQWDNHKCIENISLENPSSIYGKYKKDFSDALFKFSKENNFSAACGRVFFLYGPGEPKSRIIPSIIETLLRGEIALCSDGNQLRDFMYVADVANALVELLDSTVEGIVNIASGNQITIRFLIEEIASLMNKKNKLRFGAVPRATHDPDILIASTERLTQELNCRPQISLREGLMTTISWMKSILESELCR